MRRGVLAVSVLQDIDIEPDELGLVLTGEPSVWVSWPECRRALAGEDPESALGRHRLTTWLQARRWCADAGRDRLVPRLRALGIPVASPVHPGLEWVRHRVLGDALDLGLGAVDLDPADPDRVVVVPPPVLDDLRVPVERVWRDAAASLEELGGLAAQRARRDARGLLRPMGDCDVVTLLGSRVLRTALAADAEGLATAVVPMRRRGWTRMNLIDPAFALAAAAATDEAERGFPRPVLLTPDEVVLAAEGGRPGEVALRQPAAHEREAAAVYR